MSKSKSVKPSFAAKLMSDLLEIESEIVSVLNSSSIRIKEHPSYRTRNVSVMGRPTEYFWGQRGPATEMQCVHLKGRVKDWIDRLKLLFQNPTKNISLLIAESEENLMAVINQSRPVPKSISQAISSNQRRCTQLKSLISSIPSDTFETRVVIDTNALINCPDVDAYTTELGRKYFVHIVPVVFKEIDENKRSNRNPQVREDAAKADSRLKKYRDNGDVSVGARVSGQVYVKFEYAEPRGPHIPSWLDMTVPDDRFVASTLVLQSQYPGSSFSVVTSDLNLQTKLTAAGVPFISGKKPKAHAKSEQS